MYVDCGQCPACKQKKANLRARRICANIDDRNLNYDRLICNLTYAPEYVPYIKENELIDFLQEKEPTLNVYRDKIKFRFYNRHSKEFEVLDRKRNKPLVTYNHLDFMFKDLNTDYCINSFYNYLRKKGDRFNRFEYGKIGVCYYKDLQDLLKRIRVWFVRNGYNFRFSYYACTEYGETTSRPHIHLLLQVPRGYYKIAKTAVIESWLFSDISWDSRSIELAIKPAAYVASYVNSSDIVKGILVEGKPFKTKHSYSHGFGTVKEAFTFNKVLESFESGSLRYYQTINKDGVDTVHRLLYPKYVISRYFPKFKGFCQLAPDEVRSIVSHSDSIYNFTERLQLTFSDCQKIKVMLRNKKNELLKDDTDGSLFTRYVDAYVSIWSMWYSNILEDMHSNSVDQLEMYDNIIQFFTGEIDSGFVHLDGRLHYETDPNLFLANLERDVQLTYSFYHHNKKRKANDYLYNDLQF